MINSVCSRYSSSHNGKPHYRQDIPMDNKRLQISGMLAQAVRTLLLFNKTQMDMIGWNGQTRSILSTHLQPPTYSSTTQLTTPTQIGIMPNSCNVMIPPHRTTETQAIVKLQCIGLHSQTMAALWATAGVGVPTFPTMAALVPWTISNNCKLLEWLLIIIIIIINNNNKSSLDNIQAKNENSTHNLLLGPPKKFLTIKLRAELGPIIPHATLRHHLLELSATFHCLPII